MMRKIESLGIAAACGATLVIGLEGTANAGTSSWSTHVGMLMADNYGYWCSPSISGAGTAANPQSLESQFNIILADSTAAVEPNVQFGFATHEARAKCYPTSARSGTNFKEITTAASSSSATATCPSAYPFAAQPECEISTPLSVIFAYEGTDCGNGISSLGTAQYKGQMTGTASPAPDTAGTCGGILPSGEHERYQPVDNISFSANPLFNDTMASGANVYGTDTGAVFFDSGSLYFLFGDTFGDTAKTQTFPNWRSNVLAQTSDIDPSNGITFNSWATNGSSAQAEEIIASGHNATEYTVIPAAGFATSGTGPDGQVHDYRFAWFVSFGNLDLSVNHSGLAYSADGAAWVRTDQTPPAGTNPPVWPATSNFGPGAIWFDRYNRWVYFFGVHVDRGGVRVARVPSSPKAVLDRTQYQYWAGPCVVPLVSGLNCEWVKDSGNYSAATSQTYGGLFSDAADLIAQTSTELPYSEMSVAYDSYANRWIMMVENLASQVQIETWQAATITPPSGTTASPWTLVSNSSSALPRSHAASGAAYAPETGDPLLLNGGSDVYFLLSEWDCVYNTGLWHYTVHRATSRCF